MRPTRIPVPSNRRAAATLAAAVLAGGACSLCVTRHAHGQPVQIFNPNWNITLTDSGYSDWLYDNTPGFEGREYLCGEWGAAVGYKKSGASARSTGVVPPTWLEPNFSFPDWQTNSTFHTVNPIAVTGTTPGGLDYAASSTIASNDLRIDLTYEMVDTVTGMKMGRSPASAASGSSIDSNRYVLKQTYTITNVSGEAIQDLNLFQFMHALNGISSTYDNRDYAGAQGNYRFDTTQAAVDYLYSSSGTTLRDYIGFASKVAPLAFENGQYGIDTVDNHASGKPSVGTHISVENDTLNNVDLYDGQPWVAGAQKFSLGNLADSQSASFDVLLGIRTGTVINQSGDCQGSANGGSSVPGGVDYHFVNVTEPGDLFAEYSIADDDEMQEHVLAGEFTTPTFQSVAGLTQLFEVEFEGAFEDEVTLTFGYNDLILPEGFDELSLTMYHFIHGAWENAEGIVDSAANTIEVKTNTLSPFAIGAEVPEPASAVVAALVMLCAAPRPRRRRRR